MVSLRVTKSEVNAKLAKSKTRELREAKAASSTRNRKTERKHYVSILEQFHCESVQYDFDIPVDSFKAKSFAKETGLKRDDRWAAVLPSDDLRSGYHVHFSGSWDSERVHMRIEYWDNSVRRRADHPPPV